MKPSGHEAAASAWATRRSRDPLDLWEALVGAAPLVRVAAGCPVPTEGLLDSGAAAVLDGVVRLYTVTAAGRQLTMRYCRLGDLVGLSSIAGAAGFRAEAVTAVTLAVLPSGALRDAALSDARFGWSLAQEIAAASIEGVRTLTGRQQRSTLSQVAAHLLEFGEISSDGTMVARANHQQLADATGTAREVVTRALSTLRDCGLVATRRGAVVIIDPATLSHIADGEEPSGHADADGGLRKTAAATSLATHATGATTAP